MTFNRRTFLLLASTAVVASPVEAASIADRIWTGGPILTMNDAAMRAEAVAERGGRIVAVGSAAEVMALKGPNTQIVDLGGRTMLPGFFDAHGHIFVGGFQALSANLLAPPDGAVTDIPSLQKIVRDWAAANREAVERFGLIMGFGYDNASLAERRHPTREDLDAISVEFPIYLVHQSGHLGAANSKAIELVGYTRDTEDPPGGVIRRRPDGEPNGVFEELAHYPAFIKMLTKLGPIGAKELARAGAELWARFGFTTAQEGASLPAIAETLRQVADEGGFKIDVVTYCVINLDRDYIRKNASRDYRNRLRLGGAKLTIDGSPQGFTAWRDRPYYDPVGDYPPGYAGYAAVQPKDTTEFVDWAFANDIQLFVHANGEAASDSLIAAVKAATKRHGANADRRLTLIHGQFLREDQVDDYRRLDVFCSLFPMHTFYWGDWHREHTVGPALVDNISPTGWLVKRGMKFSSHSDAPVAFPNPIRVLSATVTRRSRSGDIIGPDQRVGVIDALKAMTLWPAWQHFEENSKGSIEVGKLADFVVLTEDPTKVDAEMLNQIKVVETIKEGITVYAASEAELKKSELMLPPDYETLGLQEFYKWAYVERRLAALPQAFKTPDARNLFARQYDECYDSIILAELMNLPEKTEAVAWGPSPA